MKNTGKEYEKLIQEIYNEKVKDEGIKANVKHDEEIQGKTTKHQIDICWEFKHVGTISRYLIQAKDKAKNKVTKSEMLTFKAVIDDIPNSVGIFITKNGFQKGAKEVAECNSIETYSLYDKQISNQPWNTIQPVYKTENGVEYEGTPFAFKIKDGDWYIQKNEKNGDIEVIDKTTKKSLFKIPKP